MGAEVQTSDSGLKRLGFIQGYSGYVCSRGYDLSSAAYQKTAAFVPGPLQPSLKKIEVMASGYAGPLEEFLADTGSKALHYADGTVDTAVQRASGLYSSNISPVLEQQKAKHSDKIDFYVKQKDVLVSKVLDSVKFVRAQGVTGTAQALSEAVVAAVEDIRNKLPELPDAKQTYHNLFAKLESTWEAFVNHPQVKKVLSTAQGAITLPSLDFAKKQYFAVHDAVMGSSTYHKVFELATGALDGLQSGVLYKSAMDKYYPAISHIADPTLEKITTSQLYSGFLEQLKPVHAAQKHAAT